MLKILLRAMTILFVLTSLEAWATQGANDCSTLLDSFTGGANENPITTNWTVDAFPNAAGGDLHRIANDGVRAATADTWGSAWYDVDTNIGPDVEACATIPTVESLLAVEIFVRVQSVGVAGAADGYFIFAHASGASDGVYRRDNDNGGDTAISTAAVTWAAGDQVKIEVTGTGGTVTVKGYRKPSGGSWSEIHSGTDTSASRITAAGPVAIAINASVTTATYFDDVYGNTLGAATPRRPVAPIIFSSLRELVHGMFNLLEPSYVLAR